MKQIVYTISFLLVFYNSSKGQVIDEFTDGDFSMNPSWQGDTTHFNVNAQHQLQLQASSAGTSILTTTINLNGIDTIQWNLYIEESFAPSSQNYGRFYLFADQSNCLQAQNAFYLQFGETGSNDAIELVKQNGSSHTVLGRGADGRIASAFGVSIKVLFINNNQFEVYTDFTGGDNYQLEFTANHMFGFTNGFIGWQCTYTISNANAFYLDNIYAGDFIRDTTPPSIIATSFTNDSILKVVFNEPLLGFNHQTDVSLKPSNLNIIQVTATSDSSAFDFSMNTSLRSGDSVILCFYNLQDQANNRTDSICDTMIYIQLEHPLAGDIVINEIMCNPNGANYLPNVEYIELYNNSSNYLSTSSMTLSDPSTIGVLPDDTMPPKSYKVYTNSSGKTLLESYGVKAIALSNFPSLNNDGDCITFFQIQFIYLRLITHIFIVDCFRFFIRDFWINNRNSSHFMDNYTIYVYFILVITPTFNKLLET